MNDQKDKTMHIMSTNSDGLMRDVWSNEKILHEQKIHDNRLLICKHFLEDMRHNKQVAMLRIKT